ncbi:Fmn-binding split barrel [Thalictrum thalictroides]|uniref:Fmn-binding split barrel n=1 Tax=Thalictrum thalictroides TaxID=46969 RepID=A0A7J6WQK1_THATH|nr:Fmn-binding split barrel [Thalictrum thalictroides]
MMGSKGLVLTYSEKCKNILASNWQAYLNTIKADAEGSNREIHSSKVSYFLRRGKPYLWVPEDDIHNVNSIIDDRGSLAVPNPYPGPLANVLRSIKKLPTRVALAGDLLPLTEEKVHSFAESIRETILSEQKKISQASYSVSSILTSSSSNCMSRFEHLQDVLNGTVPYVVYKFNIRSCTYIDANGVDHDLEMDEMVSSKPDQISPYSAKLIDGINQSHSMRRALMFFCHVYLNVNAKDALMLSMDRKGFEVMAKVSSQKTTKDGFAEYQWREYRFTFKEEACDIETFCRLLVEMEEEALKDVASYSGLQ